MKRRLLKYGSIVAAIAFLAVFYGLAIHNTPGTEAVKATDFNPGRITDTSTVAKSSLDWKNWQQSYKNLKDWSKQQNNQRVRRRRHIIKARWRISHMLSVARANISRKEKLKYIGPLRLLVAEVLVKFRR